MNKKEVLSLLSQYGIHPKKSFGQNFLINDSVLQKIVHAAKVNKNGCVVEVGPGLGVLTKKLLEKAKKVISIELDKGLTKLLENELKGYKNFELIQMDALEFIPPGNSYKLVANIPYNITSPLISHFLESYNRPRKIVLLIQKEVAQKICAKAQNLNVLAIHVQIFGTPRIISNVSKKSFWPEPKVDSVILEIDLFEKPLVSKKNYGKFLKIVHAGFSHKRKKLLNSLSKNLDYDKEKIENALKKCNILPSTRAENVTIEKWLQLSKSL